MKYNNHYPTTAIPTTMLAVCAIAYSIVEESITVTFLDLDI